MNEYIFFTTEGTTYPPMEGRDVDNCQILGRANGRTLEEAKNSLLKENPWIEECGFDSNSIIAEQILTKEQRKDIQTLVEHLYREELQECTKEQILKTIERLKAINSNANTVSNHAQA